VLPCDGCTVNPTHKLMRAPRVRRAWVGQIRIFRRDKSGSHGVTWFPCPGGGALHIPRDSSLPRSPCSILLVLCRPDTLPPATADPPAAPAPLARTPSAAALALASPPPSPPSPRTPPLPERCVVAVRGTHLAVLAAAPSLALRYRVLYGDVVKWGFVVPTARGQRLLGLRTLAAGATVRDGNCAPDIRAGSPARPVSTGAMPSAEAAPAPAMAITGATRGAPAVSSEQQTGAVLAASVALVGDGSREGREDASGQRARAWPGFARSGSTARHGREAHGRIM